MASDLNQIQNDDNPPTLSDGLRSKLSAWACDLAKECANGVPGAAEKARIIVRILKIDRRLRWED